MSAAVAVAIAIAIAVGTLAAAIATLRRRAAGWWMALLLQLLSALVLAWLLCLPLVRPVALQLVVLTAGATDAQLARVSADATIVALPDAPTRDGAVVVPDLATALRRHAGVSRIEVLGGGLPERDLDAARTVELAFDPAPLPPGIAEWQAPTELLAGNTWRVRGRLSGMKGVRVVLRDPAGAVVDEATPDAANGRFELTATVKQPGVLSYGLAVLDESDAVRAGTVLPLWVRSGSPVRVLVLAGAAEPELKYLRRWAVDAGIVLSSRITLGGGMGLRRGESPLDPAALAALDLLVLDERSWAALQAAERNAIQDAVRGGLGLLLRVRGTLGEGTRAQWRELGFDIAPAEIAEGVRLAGARDDDPELTRRAVAVASADSALLLRAGDGSALARWRASGSGRIAVLWLTDSFRLALAGHGASHGSLWSEVVTTLARAAGEASPHLMTQAQVRQRTVVCGLPQTAEVQAPDGRMVALLVGRDVMDRGCAAFWPTQPGWHRIATDVGDWRFAVAPHDATSTRALAARNTATQALSGMRPVAPASTVWWRAIPSMGLLLAWFALVAASWWCERKAWR